ncbi:hypothetical protein GCM10010912_68610 [Paenibacillus albidus]|uniref:Uncharacterized protein n=1 Tax=Paenibacillus albidus TaxID=2041023 RepID=A0A917FYP8_9BACL|nr:hypothetical protein GCM10010912_68610 [Paenibacillus albidus]
MEGIFAFPWTGRGLYASMEGIFAFPWTGGGLLSPSPAARGHKAGHAKDAP